MRIKVGIIFLVHLFSFFLLITSQKSEQLLLPGIFNDSTKVNLTERFSGSKNDVRSFLRAHSDELSNSSNQLHSFMVQMNGSMGKVYEIFEEFKQNQVKQKEEEILSNIIQFPHARLYTGENFTGSYEIYNFKHSSESGGCHRLQQYPGQIKSVDTEGSCVRVFSNCICARWSQAIYPGSSFAMDPKIRGVKCIGPCSATEFAQAEILDTTPKLTILKSPKSVPDLIGDMWTRSGQRNVSSRRYPITKYILGDGNRLEGVHAIIRLKHLRTHEVAEKIRQTGRRFTNHLFDLDGETEQVGFAIPLELGGPVKAYNVFLQEKAQAVKYHEEFVPVIKKYLKENPESQVLLAIVFLYENSMARKPTGAWYRMQASAATEISYGYLSNRNL